MRKAARAFVAPTLGNSLGHCLLDGMHCLQMLYTLLVPLSFHHTARSLLCRPLTPPEKAEVDGANHIFRTPSGEAITVMRSTVV